MAHDDRRCSNLGPHPSHDWDDGVAGSPIGEFVETYHCIGRRAHANTMIGRESHSSTLTPPGVEQTIKLGSGAAQYWRPGIRVYGTCPEEGEVQYEVLSIDQENMTAVVRKV